MIETKKVLVDNVTIGGDFEWFLRDKNTKEIISAEGIIKGTKDEPFKFDKGNDFYATSLDNVLAEGNIPPVKNAYEFYKSVQKLINYIESEIGDDLELAPLPAATLDYKWLQTDNSKTFGCASSLNTWTKEEVFPEPKGDNNRAAGTHIHIGYTEPSEEVNFMLGKAMDLFLAVPSILLEPPNSRRSTGYGLAGNIRHTRVGMEFRTLSSHFLSDRKLIQWSFRNTKSAIHFINSDRIREIESMGEDIQNIINNRDEESAIKLIRQFDISTIKERKNVAMFV